MTDFFCDTPVAYCAVLRDRGGPPSPGQPDQADSHRFPVALARGKHLFPFRTEQLSPSAPMVLGSQGPGRVGRRRFFCSLRGRPSTGRSPVVSCPLDAAGSNPLVAFARAHGGEALLDRRPHGARTTHSRRPCQLARVQCGPRRVSVTFVLLPVDLPVDTTVVLEQQERADQPSGGEGALRERRCPL